MSPEQIAGRDVDPRSDVFSLGVVIYQMAARQLPFSGETRAEMMQSIPQATPEPITRLNPDSHWSWNGLRSSASTRVPTPAINRRASC